MKKAVIAAGGKQYLVSEGDTLQISMVTNEAKNTTFKPLILIDGDKVDVGAPEAKGSVSADIIEQKAPGDKVTSIRFKAKKRVHKKRGHRQHFATIKITNIS
jgi:large subunit ribosomal protein L21